MAATLQRAEGVATVTLDSPVSYNALDLELLEALADSLEEAAHDRSVRTILLRAEGRMFSPGGSIDMFAESGDRVHDVVLRAGELVNRCVRVLHSPAQLSVTAAHGAVGGGAIGLLLAGDFALLAEGTTFVLGYGALAGSPDAGVSWFLARALGPRRAFELYALNQRFDAADALDLGLVNRVVAAAELDAEAAAIAARLAAGPAALASGKRLFHDAADADLEHHLDDEIRTFADNSRAAEFEEGVRAFHEKRAPDWRAARREAPA